MFTTEWYLLNAPHHCAFPAVEKQSSSHVYYLIENCTQQPTHTILVTHSSLKIKTFPHSPFRSLKLTLSSVPRALSRKNSHVYTLYQINTGLIRESRPTIVMIVRKQLPSIYNLSLSLIARYTSEHTHGTHTTNNRLYSREARAETDSRRD